MAWLLASDTVEGHLFSAGDQLPFGVEAFPGREPNDVVLWVESGAVIAGDTTCRLRPRASRFRPSGYLMA